MHSSGVTYIHIINKSLKKKKGPLGLNSRNFSLKESASMSKEKQSWDNVKDH